jgi:hypothetical protein
MTTTQTSDTPAARDSRSGGRIAAIVAGALIALAGTAVAAVGGILLGLFGGDGTIASGSHPLSTSRTALVSSVADIDDISSVADLVGDPRIRITAHSGDGGEALFVGIGRAAQVDRYLASVPTDVVTDFELDPFELTREPRDGSRQPAPPADQNIWVASGTGADSATLRWKVRDGDYRLVLMNADGSRGVNAEGDVALTASHVPTIAWSMIGGGVLLLLVGVATIGLLGRRPGTSRG